MSNTSAIRAGRAEVTVTTRDDMAKGLRAAQRRLLAFGQTVESIGAGMALVGGGITAGFIPAIRAAGNAQEAISRFEAVFKDQAKEAGAFADTLAKEVGRSATKIRDNLSSFMGFSVGMGYDPAKAREMSQQLQSLALDFASFHNISDDEAISRFISAMSGSSEVLDRFGVNIKAAAIDAELLSLGINKTSANASEQEKVLARLNIIMRAMGSQGAIGDAARTSGSFTNQLKRLTDQMYELGVTIGNHVIPVVTPLLARMNQVAQAVGEWSDRHPTLVRGLFMTAAAVGGLGIAMKALGMAFSPVVQAIVWLGSSSAVTAAIANLRALAAANATTTTAVVISRADALAAGGYAMAAAAAAKATGDAAKSASIWTKALSVSGIMGGLTALAASVKGIGVTIGAWASAITAAVAPLALVLATIAAIAVAVAAIAAEWNGGQLFGYDYSKSIARNVPIAAGIIAEMDAIEAAANDVAEAGRRANAALVRRDNNDSGAEQQAAAARDYVEALIEQHRLMRQLALEQGQSDSADNPMLDGMVRKIREAKTEADRLKAAADFSAALARSTAELEKHRVLMDQLGKLNREVFSFGANQMQSQILAVQTRAEALKDEFKELGQLTDAVAANIDRIAQKNIDDILTKPLNALRDEIIQLQIEVGGDGIDAELASLQADFAKAVRDAQAEGIEDPAYFDMLRQKYALLAEQRIQDANEVAQREAKAIESANARLDFDIGELEIRENLDGLDEELALLNHRMQRELTEAVEQGLDPDKIRRKFELLAKAAQAEFKLEMPDVNVAGTFNGRMAGMILGGGSAMERTAIATERTARNTEGIRGGGPTFAP